MIWKPAPMRTGPIRYATVGLMSNVWIEISVIWRRPSQPSGQLSELPNGVKNPIPIDNLSVMPPLT